VINTFFENNVLIMRVLYALLFFLYAFAIVLKLNRRSELKLARSFWLLALYGFFLGVNELIKIILFARGAEFSQEILQLLRITELFLRSFAYMVMLWLGIRLVSDIYPRMRYLSWVGLTLILLWFPGAVYTLSLNHDQLFLGIMDNLSRYLFVLPGLLLTGYGLLLHVKEIEKFRIPSLIRHVRGLAYTFFAGAFLIGMIASHPILWPAVLLNRNTFEQFTGIPLIFFRSIYLICVAYFVVKIVNVFEVEREHRLEDALKQQVLAEERDRIARELHDGIIQSIYGVGLKLKQHGILCEKKPEEANRQIEMIKNDLDNIIHDLRDYIEELHLEDYTSVSLKEAMIGLVGQFRDNAVMDMDLSVEGKQTGDLNIVQVNHILQITRELLSNAAKHARATIVNVQMKFKEQGISIRISDNGLGFDPTHIDSGKSWGDKQGLENIFHRVSMLQGTVVFHSAPGQGTHFEITLPYSKVSYLQSVITQNADYFKEEVQSEEQEGFE
jgi:signal transduction histidine kinase